MITAKYLSIIIRKRTFRRNTAGPFTLETRPFFFSLDRSRSFSLRLLVPQSDCGHAAESVYGMDSRLAFHVFVLCETGHKISHFGIHFHESATRNHQRVSQRCIIAKIVYLRRTHTKWEGHAKLFDVCLPHYHSLAMRLPFKTSERFCVVAIVAVNFRVCKSSRSMRCTRIMRGWEEVRLTMRAFIFPCSCFMAGERQLALMHRSIKYTGRTCIALMRNTVPRWTQFFDENSSITFWSLAFFWVCLAQSNIICKCVASITLDS